MEPRAGTMPTLVLRTQLPRRALRIDVVLRGR